MLTLLLELGDTIDGSDDTSEDDSCYNSIHMLDTFLGDIVVFGGGWFLGEKHYFLIGKFLFFRDFDGLGYEGELGYLDHDDIMLDRSFDLVESEILREDD